ncbi:MAG: hypothetical protein WEB19_01495 [Acidimicrobiia bacterium]
MTRARAARAVFGVLAAVAVATALAQPVTAASVAASASLYGDVPALPPSLPDKVAVVAHGAPVAGHVAIIVHNGTTRMVDDIRVTATATRPDGGLAVRAKTTLVEPPTLAPDGLAIAELVFPARGLTSETAFEFKVTNDSAKSRTTRGRLEVHDATLSRPVEGPVPQSLVVTLANPANKPVRSPIRITVMCFGEARNPAVVATATLKKTRLPVGATMPATVNLRELCPSYLVGAHGR